MKSVVITGASTGIGFASVEALIAQGWRVFGSVRKQEDGQELKRRFGDAFEPLVFDVRDAPAIGKSADIVANALSGATLSGLVNNAGIAKSGPLIEQSTEDFRAQVETNLIGSFSVIKAFAPLLGVDQTRSGPKGRIVNISSTAGKIGYPFLAGYCASKHGLEGLSDSLRREMLVFGIDVIVVEPGFIATPIWDKADDDISKRSEFSSEKWRVPVDSFSDFMVKMGRAGLPASRVAEDVVAALTASKPKARYAPVGGKLANFTLPKILPDRVVDGLVGKQFKLGR